MPSAKPRVSNASAKHSYDTKNFYDEYCKDLCKKLGILNYLNNNQLFEKNPSLKTWLLLKVVLLVLFGFKGTMQTSELQYVNYKPTKQFTGKVKLVLTKTLIAMEK